MLLLVTNGSGLVPLQKLPHLVTLDLGGTWLNDNGVQMLAGFEKLSWLSLAGTRIGDEALVHLPGSLLTLYLLRTKVTDAGMPALHRLPLLRELDLRETAVSEAVRAALVREHGIRLMSSP